MLFKPYYLSNGGLINLNQQMRKAKTWWVPKSLSKVGPTRYPLTLLECLKAAATQL